LARLESDHGRLLVAFQYRGVRCREYLGLRDLRENRRAALRIARELELEIASGKFDYATRFPTSRNLERLGLLPPAKAQNPATPTLGEFATTWLDERRAQLSAATAYDYLTILRTHILPSKLSEKRLEAIDDGDITRLIGELRQKHTRYGGLVSDRRINMVIARLRTIFATARRRKLISDDPMKYVDNLREPKPEVDPLTLDEAERLLAAASGQDRAIFTVLIFTGLRPNEALALSWNDVDFDREVIRIRRSINRFEGVGLPKTASSEREVDLLPNVKAVLQEQRLRSQLRSEFVFPSEARGGPLDLTNLRERNWRRLLRKSGLRPRTLYQCRHTYAALQLSRGENPQYVAHQMGHTTLEMIIRHYARWMRKPERVGRLAEQLASKIPPSLPEICQKTAEIGRPSLRTGTSKSSQVADFKGRSGGAGDRGRTGDVQLGKLAFYH
jgi:integrase